MRKFTPVIMVVVCLLGATLSLPAQNGKLKKARVYLETLQYEQAIDVYTQLVSRKPNLAEAVAGLAEANRKLSRYAAAKTWYAQAIALPDPQPIWYFHYGMMLLHTAQCDSAQVVFREFLRRKPYDSRRTELEDACAYLTTLRQKSAERISLDHPGFNGPYSDLGPAFYDDGLVFGAVRQPTNRAAYYNLFFVRPAEIDPRTREVQRYDSVEVFSHQLNTTANQAIVTFNAEGSEMYFTRNQPARKGETQGLRRLEILAARQVVGGLWDTPTPLPFNSPDYSCAHPALTPDGQRLFFSSDRPGGFGGKDLYVCYLEAGQWGEPINLGPAINTEADELYPYYHATGELYFASDGRLGLGGQDIYRTEDLGEGDWGPVENPGHPINSAADDFGLIIHATHLVGYFTSNRPGGAGADDIYFFRPRSVTLQLQLQDAEGQPLAEALPFTIEGENGAQLTTPFGSWQRRLGWDECLYLRLADAGYQPAQLEVCARQASLSDTLRLSWEVEPRTAPTAGTANEQCQLTGMVYDPSTGKPLANANLKLRSDDCSHVLQFQSNEQGAFTATLKPQCCYEVQAEHPGYFTYRLDQPLCTSNQPLLTHEVYLQPFRNRPTPADTPAVASAPTAAEANFERSEGRYDDGSVAYLLKVYYDLGRSSVRAESVPELWKLLRLLNDNPELVVEISSHTDARGGQDFNQRLSQRRADAIVRWLIANGVSRNRLVAKGYGEGLLVNACTDGVECDEAAHQRNRRTEFRVLGLLDNP